MSGMPHEPRAVAREPRPPSVPCPSRHPRVRPGRGARVAWRGGRGSGRRPADRRVRHAGPARPRLPDERAGRAEVDRVPQRSKLRLEPARTPRLPWAGRRAGAAWRARRARRCRGGWGTRPARGERADRATPAEVLVRVAQVVDRPAAHRRCAGVLVDGEPVEEADEFDARPGAAYGGTGRGGRRGRCGFQATSGSRHLLLQVTVDGRTRGGPSSGNVRFLGMSAIGAADNFRPLHRRGHE